MVNQFDSGQFTELVNISTPEGNQVITQGEAILIQFGFTDKNDEPYTFEWAVWGLLFTLSWAVLGVAGSVYALSAVRFSTGKSLVTERGDDEIEVLADEDKIEIPFKRVDLTFRDVHYTVTASTTSEKLELLKGIDGFVKSGKMTALMGRYVNVGKVCL
jgi:hypothetical protein